MAERKTNAPFLILPLLAFAAGLILLNGVLEPSWIAFWMIIPAILAVVAASGLAMASDSDAPVDDGIPTDDAVERATPSPVPGPKSSGSSQRLVRRGRVLQRAGLCLAGFGLLWSGSLGACAILLALLAGILHETAVRRPLRRLTRRKASGRSQSPAS